MKYVAPGLLALAAIAASPVAAQTFSGPYAGIEAGWVDNQVGNTRSAIGQADIGKSKDAVQTGIFAGYNYQPKPRIVVSGEAGFNLGFSDQITRSGGGKLASVDPDYGFSLAARAGYLVTDKTLVYVRGGYDNVRGSVRLVDSTGARYDRKTFDGWTLGGGVEYAVSQKVSARLEYRYSDLNGGGTHFHRDQLLLGAAYHF